MLSKTSQNSQQNINNMKETETVMSESKKVRYQWIKSEKTGKVVTVAEDQKDGKWLYFEDGTRINPTLVGEFMMPIKSDRDILPMANNTVTPQANPVQDQVDTTMVNEPSQVVKEPSIMGMMIMKMSKKNVVSVPLQINLNIPTPALYAMLTDGMEEADLNEEIMEVALQQIEIDNLTEYLKENISNFLTEYYS